MYNRVNWNSKGENYCEYEINNMSIVTETSVQFGFHLCFVSNVRKQLMQIITDNVYVWRNWMNENSIQLCESKQSNWNMENVARKNKKEKEREKERGREKEMEEGRKEKRKEKGAEVQKKKEHTTKLDLTLCH